MGLWCIKCMFQIYSSPELLFIDCFVCFETEYIQDLFFNMEVWITVHLECQNMLFHEGHLFPGFNAYYNLKYIIFILLYLFYSCDMYHVSDSFWIFVLSSLPPPPPPPLFTVINIKVLTYIKKYTTHYSFSISNSKALFKFWGFDINNICSTP